METQAAQPAEPPAPPGAAEALEAWLDNHVRNTGLAINTALWNRIQGGIQAIRSALAEGGK